MPRPTTKEELIEAANGQYAKLWKLIDSMSDREREGTFLFEDRDRCVRDVLIHLYEWHQLLLRWGEANLAGNARPFIPAPYNWKTYGQMNVEFWGKHQSTPYADAAAMLEESHGQVMRFIEGFSNEELFTKKHYSWTGTSSLGSYCVSATSSHYDWAMKKLRKHVKSYKEAN